MKISSISKYLANNSLSQEEIYSLLRKEIGPAMGCQYADGYLASIRHIKRRREARARRIDVEFGKAMDFLNDLTYDK